MASNAIIEQAYKRYKQLALTECFDAANLESRPTAAQWEIFNDMGKVPYRWVVAAQQSGKTSTPVREIAWILTDTHPFWKRPLEWGTESLLILIAGQDKKMMEIEIWSKKLKPFLDENLWKEVRVGNGLQHVENRKTKDKIIFMSHNDSSERARTHMQGYVAHYVWVDESPSSIRIIEELQRRVDARSGYFIATFTSKSRNDEMRRLVENAKLPLAKQYRLLKLDNPIYANRKQEEIDKMDGYPEALKNSILYGDWYIGDNAVYQFDEKEMVEAPLGYSRAWRHVEASDPALQSKFGFTLWAECPSNGQWYCVKDEYIEGIATPERMLEEVLRRTEGYNMVRRISDPHEAWYINTASAKGIYYQTPFNKNSRKGELIKGLQQALSATIKIAPWCRNIQTEFSTCQWSENAVDKIVNGSKYHLLDAAQYFVDCRPTSEVPIIRKPWWEEMRAAHKTQKRTESIYKRMQRSGRRKWLLTPTSLRRLF